MIRSLDSLESYLSIMNRHVPTHFVMAASLHGIVEDQRWLSAFVALQQRHILLRAAIRVEAEGKLVFVEVRETPIPVTFLPRTTDDEWKRCYAEQVRCSFGPADAPLLRIFVIRSTAKTDVVIACHHAVSDAMGIAYLLRDAISVANGHSLPRMTPYTPTATDTLWAEQKPGLLPLDGPPPPAGPPRRYLLQPAPLPQVDCETLSEETTARLRERSAKEKVSMHAVLCATTVLAGGSLCPDWRAAPVRIATPVDLRDRLGLRDELCLAITAFGHSCEYRNGQDLWSLARQVQAQLIASTTDAALLTASRSLGALMQAGEGTDVLPLLIALSPAYEVMISNLRVLHLEGAAGALRLDDLWGPTTLQQFEGQQSLGVSTFDRQLRLTLVSYTPIPDLLSKIKEILLTSVL